MWTLLREVSFRHLRHSPLRTALVIFGIALGVCMLSAVLATNESLVAAFEDMVDRVAGKADLTVSGKPVGRVGLRYKGSDGTLGACFDQGVTGRSWWPSNGPL